MIKLRRIWDYKINIKEIYFPRSLKNFGEQVAYGAFFKKMYVPKGFANVLYRKLSISMLGGDYQLEEYDVLPMECEVRKQFLQRFIHAQDSGGLYDNTGTYAEALQEVKNGFKRGHWMWYVFPQM